MSSIVPPIVASACDRWSIDAPACAVAVGNFDGVHRGHAAIVSRLVDVARGQGMPAVVLSFDPHPAAVVRPSAAPAPITTPGRRAALLRALGVDAVLVQPTDREFVALPAERFYTEILRGRLRARAIVEGRDFRFGAGRGGDVALLAKLCADDRIVLETVPPVLVGGVPVSSSRVRELISAGAVREAAELLTVAYRLSGTVVAGAGRGGPLGFPTANLGDIATLLPATGVYAGRVTLPDGGTHAAAVHVGPRLSFDEPGIAVEAHLVGFSGTLYGSTLDVDFLDRLRDTHRFASVDALRMQLAADVARASQVVGSRTPSAGAVG